jgi:hypothetical protein
MIVGFFFNSPAELLGRCELTQWRRSLTEKMVVAQLGRKLPASCGIAKHVAVFMSDHQWFLS